MTGTTGVARRRAEPRPETWREALAGLPAHERAVFEDRLALHRDDVVRPLRRLYGRFPDFDRWLDRALATVAQRYAARPGALKRYDLRRLAEPDWFQRAGRIGYVCYVDRFAGTLDGVADKIPYLRELGVDYLHLMPLLLPRPGENDGRYAVADYRRVDPALGTIEDLERLAARLRERGISLCVDLVCNHTAREHPWARRALAGEAEFLDYYWTFKDRTLPERYERHLREIFPTFAPGNFTYEPAIERWVWTTFHDYQWDLNYANPQVFVEMLDNILFLANLGVDVVRLDAVAFLWKRLGTPCENLPETHALLQAWRALTRIAAPALVHKAEAIVGPHDLVPYLGRGRAAGKECELAYHNVFMVLLWSGLAERHVGLMTHVLQQMPQIPAGAAWVTYARCHDDVGWAVTEEDAAAVGLDGAAHRAFLSDFYSGVFAGSFARGVTFQDNPETNDRRISGSLASLAGLETALAGDDPRELDLAVRRILLLHALIFAYGGIPLIYMGDEIGLLNDPGYRDDPRYADDTRWLHRPRMDWDKAARRADADSLTGRLFHGLRRRAEARCRTFALHAEASSRAEWTGNDRVFGLLRSSPRGRLLVLANFSDEYQSVPAYRLRELGFEAPVYDWLAGRLLEPRGELSLQPYECLWLEQAISPEETAPETAPDTSPETTPETLS